MKPFADLDELVLQVRSSSARAHISEAIACYHAGALRAAVVVTWSSVVYDIIGKLQELEIAGDKNAQKHVAAFETIRKSNDVSASQDMERRILDIAAADFELLTRQERIDFERLREDRHRCAHPTMNTSEEAYQPSAELVRYHLRNALTHLLTKPPVQGRVAFTKLVQEVKSPLFPRSADGALRVMQAGPLERPRGALLRDFVLATIKEALLSDAADDRDYLARLLAALQATKAMHPAAIQAIYASELQRILQRVPDDRLRRVIRIGESLPDLWECMPENVTVKLESLTKVVSGDELPETLLGAAAQPQLRVVAEQAIAALSPAELISLVRADPTRAARLRPVIDRALQLLAESISFNNTNGIVTSVLKPLTHEFGEDDLLRIVSAINKNVEVRHAWAMPGLLRAVRESRHISPERFGRIIADSGVGEFYEVELAISGDVSKTSDDLSDDELDALLAEANEAPIPTDAKLPAVHARFWIPEKGTRVQHERFGDGTVHEISGEGRETKVTVDFDGATVGRKRLVAVYAGLRPKE